VEDCFAFLKQVREIQPQSNQVFVMDKTGVCFDNTPIQPMRNAEDTKCSNIVTFQTLVVKHTFCNLSSS
jgi:hypothetical protein